MRVRDDFMGLGGAVDADGVIDMGNVDTEYADSLELRIGLLSAIDRLPFCFFVVLFCLEAAGPSDT